MEPSFDAQLDEEAPFPVAPPRHAGEIGVRVTVDAGGRRATQLSIASVLLTIPLARQSGSGLAQTIIMVGGAVLFMMLGYAIGSRQRRTTCSICDCAIGPSETLCSCGCTFIADITGGERLALDQTIASLGVEKGITTFVAERNARTRINWGKTVRWLAIGIAVVCCVWVLAMNHE